MEVSVQTKPEESTAELKVRIPQREFEPFLKKAAQKLSKDHPLKGFRPGKAPVEAVAEHLGQEFLLQEAVELALPHFFVEAAAEYDVEAINRPKVSVDEVGLKQDLAFVATVDVLPKVTLGDPKQVAAEKRETTASDEHIDKELQYLASTRAQMIEVARPAQEGDTVSIDFEISVNGQPIEGGAAQEHPVTLGEGAFLPDFEKGLTGISAGDTREFAMNFPEDYGKKDLQGKAAQAKVTARKVEKKVLPEINDEFAQQLGEFKDLADLKQKLRENTEMEMKEREQERYLGELAEKLMEVSEFTKIPDVLIDREVDGRLMEFAQMLAYQQKSLEDYLQHEGKTLEQMRADMREVAEKRVKIGLTLRAFAQEQDIQVSPEEVEQEAAKELAQFKTVEQAEQHVDPHELKERIESVLRNRKTLERLAEMVTSE